jgi:Cu(I)/Ag(I) efflux system membrane fusion protein
MHPQIVSDKPGTCPICKMDLVPMQKAGTKTSLMLSESQIQLANIRTIKVGEGNFNTSKSLTGRLVTNPQSTELVSSRFPGRIERLYVRETGQQVAKGQPLYQIYSEQLQVLQQDYLLQVRQVAAFPGEKIYISLKEAAKNKLKLFGYSDAQISSLGKSNQLSPTVTIYAPASGVASEIMVTEGQYIGEGSGIVRLENYSRLWVEADLYPSEIDVVKLGSIIKVVVSGSENIAQNARVDFISPAINPSTQRLTIRAAIGNASGKFQAGMQATVLLATGTITKAVRLPVEAVIRDENGAHVWIKANNSFSERKVTTGAEDASQIVVTSGITNGEEVVSSGAYLLHSESVLKKGGSQ